MDLLLDPLLKQHKDLFNLIRKDLKNKTKK